MRELPKLFKARMKQQLKEEYEDFLACYEREGYAGLRVNTEKISVERFRGLFPFPLEPVPWTDCGFYYEKMREQDEEEARKAAGVTKHPYYYAGLYYIQEPSAMLPASVLPVNPGDRVLDLCAAPGGKSTHLAAKLGGKGLLVANDASASRAKALLKNLTVWGCTNSVITGETPEKLLEAFGCFFDKILVDAPCSGEGMFRKDAGLVKSWEERGPQEYAAIQKQILDCAVKMLRPSGMLLYSTCTFSVQENEENIAFLLRNCPDMRLVRPKWNPYFSYGKKKGFEDCIRIFPHLAEGEGHFAALLEKKTEENVDAAAVQSEKKLSDQSNRKLLAAYPELADFMGNLTKKMEGSIVMQSERIYLLPPSTQIRHSVRYLRTGLYLGELKKKRFEPSQALAVCLKENDFSRSISFNVQDERVLRYLKGETLDLSGTAWADFQGWVLVCVDGYGLGWAKAAGETLKNKYYAGWRMQA